MSRRVIKGKNPEVVSEYRRLRTNFIAQVNRMKRNGYKFAKNPIPDIPKNVTEGSIRNLERKRAKLYDISTKEVFDSSNNVYKTITGTLAKALTKLEGIKKAVKTRLKHNAKKKKKQETNFEAWAQEFIDSAPLKDRANAENYVETIREGYYDGGETPSYEEWLASLGEVSSEDSFNNVMGEDIENVAPNTYEYLQDMFKREHSYVGESKMLDRFDSYEGELPELEIYYTSSNGQLMVSATNVKRFASIIKGRPLTGAESRALSKAIEKDNG